MPRVVFIFAKIDDDMNKRSHTVQKKIHFIMIENNQIYIPNITTRYGI